MGKVNQGVLLFVKAPELGKVKTRLASVLGDRAALALYRCFVSDVLAMLARGGYRLWIFFDPPEARQRVERWLGGGHRLLPQAGDDLGERMANAFSAAFAGGMDAALLIGSDIPDLPNAVLDEGLAALAEHDAVLGPAGDGGYYLIGFRRGTFLPAVFAGIPWSTPEVCARTLEIMAAAGLRVHLLPRRWDVDGPADLEALILRSRGTAFAASATLGWIGREGLLSGTGQGEAS